MQPNPATYIVAQVDPYTIDRSTNAPLIIRFVTARSSAAWAHVALVAAVNRSSADELAAFAVIAI